MEADFWHERWSDGRIRFNQAAPNPLLVEHWSQLGCPQGAEVFVPLCGKSIDMVWLASQGHQVIGSELSARAVADFFSEQGLRAEQRSQGPLTVDTADDYELWTGDFFDLPAAALANVGAVYDRASLVALPADLRRRYAAHLIEVLPAGSPIFIISFEYDQSEMDGPPFSVPAAEIDALFGHAFDIERISADERLERNSDLKQRGLSRLTESLTFLRPRS